MKELDSKNEFKQKPYFLKSKMLLGIICLLIIGLGITGYSVNKSNKAKAEELRIADELKEIEKVENEYQRNLLIMVEEINLANISVPPMIGLYSEMWSISLKQDMDIRKFSKHFNVSDSIVLGYAPKASGNFIIKGDFNTTLDVIYNLKIGDGTIGELEDLREKVKSQMNNLKNPPEKYEEYYKEVVNFYTLFAKYIDMAIFPNGSYTSYTSDVNNISMEIESLYQKLRIMMP